MTTTTTTNNVYDDHPIMFPDGKIWRCEHGKTGWSDGVWVGCRRCAIWRPLKAFKIWWEFEK